MSYSQIKLIRSFNDDTKPDLVERIAIELECAETTRRAIAKIEKSLEAAKKVYEIAKSECDQHVVDTQNRCDHVISTFYPDASGNNDAHTDCDICGKELCRDTEYRWS